MAATPLLIDAETVNPGWKDKINEVIAWKNAQTGNTVPVGAILPYFGNPNDASLFDVSGVGVPGTDMEKFALCLGQGLTGSLLKNHDGTDRAITPDLKGKFPVGWSAGESEFAQINLTGGTKEHKHVWSERTPTTLKSRNALGVLKDWIFMTEQRQVGSGNTAAPASGYVADFPDGKTYTDTINHLPPFLTTGFIIRYK